jgi:hypothetical protein
VALNERNLRQVLRLRAERFVYGRVYTDPREAERELDADPRRPSQA